MCVHLCIYSAAGGEIFDHCVSEELLPEAQITRLIWQTLEGVHHLHQSNLVHLDLKVCTHTQKITCISVAETKGIFVYMFNRFTTNSPLKCSAVCFLFFSAVVH